MVYRGTWTYNLLKLILYSKPSVDSQCLRNLPQDRGCGPVIEHLSGPYEVLESIPYKGKNKNFQSYRFISY